MPRNQAISSRVLSYLSQHAGQSFTADDIATEFRVSRDQAAKSLSYLKAREHIDSLISGSYVYRKTPNKKVAEHAAVFEYLGTIKDGRIIAKGDDDKIYAFEEL